MSEVEKMYENAGIEKSCNSDLEFCPVEFCDECNLNIYPQFTAEKQLELIKWMIKTNHRYFIQDVFECEFEESLAKVLNLYWQDLIESEQEQIRSILNG